MEVQIRSDGQLYPPRQQEKPKPPPPKPAPPEPPCPPHSAPQEPPWEDLLLVGIALLVLRGKNRPDIPMLLALAYILFDRQFDIKKLIP